MPDNDVQKQTSAMANRLKDVLDECKKTNGEKILVPQDIKKRMKTLCSETEKIIKDMPNKKFSVALHLHASEKAKKYLKTLDVEKGKLLYNYFAFGRLESFYGMYQGNVKSSIKKYSDKMSKCNKKSKDIYDEIKKLVESNSKLSNEKRLDPSIVLNKEDRNLINSGCLLGYDKNIKDQTYEEYIKAFFDRFINYRIGGDDEKDLVGAFKDISIALKKLKVKVSSNEKSIVGGGIKRSRGYACSQMHEISGNVNYIIREANESISFLKSLPIKSSKLAEERDKQVRIIEKAVSDCNSILNNIDVFKSSIMYGETTFPSDKKSPLAIGKGFNGTFLRANSLRRSLNMFIKLLNDIVSDIQGGGKVKLVSDEASNLNKLFRGIEEDLKGFKTEVDNFEGYFKKDGDKNKISNVETLRRIDAEYNRIAQILVKINTTLGAREEVEKLRDMEKKIKKEVKEYDKVSSKIKRGVKKVLHVMETIARYTLNVTSFLRNVLLISDTWNGLTQAFLETDKQAAQVQYVSVPITVSEN